MPNAGLPRLTCLGLRQCYTLPAEALGALQVVSSLRALDLQGLAQLEDSALALIVARLPQLWVLNVSDTGAGDITLNALTFAHRASAWAATYGECTLPW